MIFRAACGRLLAPAWLMLALTFARLALRELLRP